MIREACLSDVDFIVGETKAFARFYGTKRSLFPDDATAKVIITNLIENHVMFVGQIGQELAGFIGGFLTPHHFNPAITVLSEALWWVAKPYRGTKIGSELLNQFTAAGKAKADWVTMTLEHHSPVKIESILRRGYKYQERAFLLEIGV